MSWTINGIRVYTQEYNESVRQQIARLQPLAGGTVLHIFGYEEPIIKIRGKVVGSGNFELLKATTTLGTTVSFVSDLDTKNVTVLNVTGSRDRSISQTIDILQACDSPVYSVDVEVYQDL